MYIKKLVKFFLFIFCFNGTYIFQSSVVSAFYLINERFFGAIISVSYRNFTIGIALATSRFYEDRRRFT